ncbi:MAG: SagB/ThcOx family dehydrogenase [Halobacteria archaeon]
MIDVNKLRKLRSQVIDPGHTQIAPTFNDDFLEKEFSESGISELLHEKTKTTENSSPIEDQSIIKFNTDDSLQFAISKIDPDYPDKKLIELPEPEGLDTDLGEVLMRRRSKRSFTGKEIDLGNLATLLKHAVGTNGTAKAGDGSDKKLRTYPSGGGMYPVEIYLIIPRDGENIEKGLYYYAPNRHGLRVLEKGVTEEEIEELYKEDLADYADSSVIFALTGTFARQKAKYGERAYGFSLMEAGHIAQNILLVSNALGFDGVPLASANDRKFEEYLDVNGVDESLVYTVCVGEGETDE